LRAVRRLGILIPIVDHESAAAIEQLVEATGYRARLARAMGRMSAAERVAVELRVLSELDYGEIATGLRCSEASTRTRVHRGLARLNQLAARSADGGRS
jgi:DNA-directed RNA polymerase specialized sigma24 family protein